jgi:2-keto-3-deoxy-L-rhamnonate aldolase RhmA
MRNNWVREKLQAGEATLGALMGLGSPNVAELLAHAGYDWLVIETEHNGLDFAEIQHMLMAINGTDTIPIVRVASHDPIGIQRALDVGGMGILAPMVKTADEARAIVSATRYPPEGTRGFGPLRASHYTFDYPDYLTRANDNMLVALILETKEAVENLEEIADVPGVDALMLGLWDLCLSYNLNPLHMPFPEIEAAIERALDVGRNCDVAVGIGAGAPEELRARLDQGFQFMAYGTDYMLLAGAAKQGIEAFRDHGQSCGRTAG